MKTVSRLGFICILSIAAASILPPAISLATVIERVSVKTGGQQGNAGSWFSSSISADGRYVAFTSGSTNLVNGDTNGRDDVFVRDRQTGQTTRVSIKTGGEQGNGQSNSPSISADGRYVAFASVATNLVAGDTNTFSDIFVHDRQTGQTTRVSVKTGGEQGSGNSENPSISADGRYVTFESTATNLADGDTNGLRDIFVHDRQTGQTTRVSIKTGGQQGNESSWRPAISADGRYVAFDSMAGNLVDGDTNGVPDIFVHDRQTGQTTRVSIKTDGGQGNGYSNAPAISADGRYVAFESWATNLVDGDTNGTEDIFVHDRQTGQTTRVSIKTGGEQGNDASPNPAISADGRYVTFSSCATNLVDGDTNGWWDIFVHDRQTGQTTRVSIKNSGEQGNESSWYPAISADGRYVALGSDASNLVDGDTNNRADVFVARNFEYRYVSPDGSDSRFSRSNNCLSTTFPCKTIQHAAGVSGDLDAVRLAQGVYQENLLLTDQSMYEIEGGWTNDFSKKVNAPEETQIDGANLDSVLRIEAQTEPVHLNLSGLTLKKGAKPNIGTGTYYGISVMNPQADVTLQVTRCILRENNSAIGIDNRNGAEVSLTLDSSILTENHTGGYGSGVDVYTLSTSPVVINMVNTVLANNWSEHNGGAVRLYNVGSNSRLHMTNTTISGNQALRGGGIYVYNDATSGVAVSLTNTILWGNTAVDNNIGADLYIQSSNPLANTCDISASYSDVGGIYDTGGFFKNMGGNINKDPLLRALKTDDFHLRGNSPAVDSGICGVLMPITFAYVRIAPESDYEGDTRSSLFSGCDMGADEFAPKAISPIFLLLLDK
jgi:Tol biopolymer transport system component